MAGESVAVNGLTDYPLLQIHRLGLRAGDVEKGSIKLLAVLTTIS